MKRLILIGLVTMALAAPAALGQAVGATSNVPRAMQARVESPQIDAPLLEALAQIGEMAGMTVAVDWDVLRATGVGPDTRVVARRPATTVALLLETILLQVSSPGFPLGWYVQDGNIHVTTQMRALYRPTGATVRATPVGAPGAVGAPSPMAPPAPRPMAPAMPAPPAQQAWAGPAAPAPRGQGGIREINFQDVPLLDVIEFYRSVSGVNFFVNWDSLRASGIDQGTPVTLQLQNVSVATALDLTLDQVSGDMDKYGRVYWIVRHGLVHVASGQALNQMPPVTRIYDVGDILMPIPNFYAADLGFGQDDSSWGSRDDRWGGTTSGGWGGTTTSRTGTGGGLFDTGRDRGDRRDRDRGGVDTQQIREQNEETLISMIREAAGEEMWVEAGGRGSIRILRNQLIVSQTPMGFKMLEGVLP